MNVRPVVRAVAAVLLVIGGAMLSSVPVALLSGDPRQIWCKLLVIASVTMLVGGAGVRLPAGDGQAHLREGFAIVTFSWIVASVFGGLPYVWIGGLSPTDAFFETMSGFTTTGASILDNIEEQARGVLYWRALTQWLGGMGIVVLSLAILPLLGAGGTRMYYAEVPGPTTDQLAPRIASASKLLWGAYVLITAALILLLRLGGVSLYESACHAFCAMSTGGFSTRQASVAAYGSAYIDGVLTVFMFLAGANFILHLRALTGRPLNYWSDDEFVLYFGICVASVTAITANLYLANTYPLGRCLQYSAFTVASMITTTGFCTGDFDTWPMFSRLLLVLLMCIGGCGGSTAGGMKVSRLLLAAKYGLAQLRRCCYPRSIINIHFNRERVRDAVITRTLGFFVLFVGLILLIALLVAVIEPNLGRIPAGTPPGQAYSPLETALTSAVATLCNIGPGLSKVGATRNYAWMAPQTKWLLSLAMLVGRLEIFTVLVLLLPRFWRK